MVSAKLITAAVVVSSASGAAATLHGYAGKYHGLDWYYDSNGEKCRTVQKDDGDVQTVYYTATEINEVYVTSTYFHCSDGKCSKGTYSTPAPATPTRGPNIVTLTYTQVVDRTEFVKVTYCSESEATSFVPPTTSLSQPKPTATFTTTQCEERVYNWWDTKEKCSKKYTHKCSNKPQPTSTPAQVTSSSPAKPASSAPVVTECVPDTFLYWHPREKCSKTVQRGCSVTSSVPSNTATCTPYEASRFNKHGKCDKKTTVYDCGKPTTSSAVAPVVSSSAPVPVISTKPAPSVPVVTECVPDTFLYWHPREKCSKTVQRGCSVTSSVPSNTATCTPYEASRFNKHGNSLLATASSAPASSAPASSAPASSAPASSAPASSAPASSAPASSAPASSAPASSAPASSAPASSAPASSAPASSAPASSAPASSAPASSASVSSSILATASSAPVSSIPAVTSSAPVVLPSSSTFSGWNSTFVIASSSASTVDSLSSAAVTSSASSITVTFPGSSTVPTCGVNTFTSPDGRVHVSTMTEGCSATGSVPAPASSAPASSAPVSSSLLATASSAPASSAPASSAPASSAPASSAPASSAPASSAP
ncbi:hypothetical protein DV452_005086, partial [Geotrichum candidum]